MHTTPAFSDDELRAIPEHVFAPLRGRIDALVEQLPDLAQLEDKNDYSRTIFTPAFIDPEIILGFFKWYFNNLTSEKLDAMQLQNALNSNVHSLKLPITGFALKENFRFKDAGQHPLTQTEHHEAWQFLWDKAPALVPGMAMISNALMTYFAAAKVKVVDPYIIAASGVEQVNGVELESINISDLRYGGIFSEPDGEDVLYRKYQVYNMQEALNLAKENASLDSMVHEYLPLLIHPSSQSEEGVTDHNLRKGMKDSFVNAAVFESVRWRTFYAYEAYQNPSEVAARGSTTFQVELPRVAICPFKKTIGFLMNAGVSVKEGREFVIEPNAGPAAMLMFTTQLYRGYRQSGYKTRFDVEGPS